MPTKTATKKKAVRKAPAKKKVAKKATSKKTVAKKSLTKKPVRRGVKAVAKKKTSVKKKAASKKKAVSRSRKPASRVTKTATRKKTVPQKLAVTAKAKQRTKRILKKEIELPADNNLAPVEEKSPEINTNKIIAPGMDNKSLQRAAVRNYDNHNVRLSTRKGGIKPAGKKPLW